ncbi:MAG: hypothetical protein HY652_09745 [Acidobacteria bacterium]|nr:hypothetical protein [Acidobacteriota bacterium]
MNTTRILAASLAMGLAMPATAMAQSRRTILFFVRHAEPQTKLVSTGPGIWTEECNPRRSCCTTILNPLGLERREALAQWFVDQGLAWTVTHLIGDNKQRTVETLQKLATLSGLKIQQYPRAVGECDPGFETAAGSQRAVVSAIRALPSGSRAVIANHTDTLYRIMSDSVGIDTSDAVNFPKEPGSTSRLHGFDNLWIVEVDDAGVGRLLQHITLELKPEGSSEFTGLGRAENPSTGVFYFAQAGGGAGYTTTITLSNPSTTKSANTTIAFFGSDGKPLDAAASSAVIPPAGKVTISTGGQEPARSGYARVSSSDPLIATARYSLPRLRPQEVRFESPPPARAGTRYSFLWLPSVVVGPSTRAYVLLAPISRDLPRGIENGVAIANVSDATVRVLLSLSDSSGIESLRSSVVLAPREQISRTLIELIPGVPEKFGGTLRIAASPPLFPIQSIETIAVTMLQFGPGELNEVPLTVVQ